jgi:DNA-3-methyladenine glycosylase II
MPELRFDVDVIPPYRLRWHEHGDGPIRAMWLHAQPVAIRLEQEADDAPVTAHVASTAPLGPVADLAREAARHMACADDDLAAFRRAVAGDPPMAALADRFPGLKPLRILDLWTALLRALVSQQISGAAARAIERRLAERFGARVELGDTVVPVVPDAETVLRLPVHQLAEAGLSGRKAEYAREIAEAVVSGAVSRERLLRMTPEEAMTALVDLRGVGRWTAECAAIFGLGERDVLPADDLGVRKAVAHLYHLPAVPAAAEVRRIGERWTGWRSYAAVYLWHSLGQARTPE